MTATLISRFLQPGNDTVVDLVANLLYLCGVVLIEGEKLESGDRELRLDE
jgi:hypothetical protein